VRAPSEDFFKQKSGIVDMFSRDNVAQGAIEYLLIIGAAILVVAIVIIAIISVLNQGQNQNTSGLESAKSSFDSLKETSGAYFRINNFYYLKSDPISQNLISIWRLNESSVSEAFPDSAGNYSLTCDSVANTCPTPAEGLFGEKALKFDGVDDYLILNTYPNNLERTISLWVRPDFDLVGNDGLNYYLFTTNTSGTPEQNWGVVVLRNKSDYKDIIYYPCSYTVGFGDCGVEYNILNNEVILKSGNWYLLTFVSSKQNGGFVKIYLNNSEKASSSGAVLSSANILPGIAFGKFESAPAGDGIFRYFKGSIGEISIWNKALSGEEIRLLYNNAISVN